MRAVPSHRGRMPRCRPCLWLLTAVLLHVCGQSVAGPILETILAGQPYLLELALDPAARYRGLSGRSEIPEGTGMLFVYPSPRPLTFVMRDCLVDIDLAYLDNTGRITRTYRMKVELPRGPEESVVVYENRLKRYASMASAQFVLELGSGELEGLGLRAGDRISLPLAELAAGAR